MRWLFFALLTANGLLAFWLVLEHQGAPTTVPSARNRLPSIPMLHEVAAPVPAAASVGIRPEVRDAEPAPPAVPATEAEGSAKPGSETGVLGDAQRAGEGQVTDAAAPPMDALPAPSGGSAANPGGAAAAVPAPEAPPQKAIDSEPAMAVAAPPAAAAPPGRTDALAPEGQDSVVDPPKDVGGVKCWQSAAYRDTGEATRVELALRSRGWLTERVTKPALGTAGYIVYWPRFKDRATALAKMHELRQRGVDSFVIAEGEWQNGLSLGLFSREENAERHAEELRRKGLQALVGPRQREESLVHFIVRAPSGQDVATVEGGGFREISCN